MADGTRVAISQLIEARVATSKRTTKHQFATLPGLSTAVLIGTDLWAKLRFTLPPPPTRMASWGPAIGTVSRATIGAPDSEADRLKEFWAGELPKFEQITGPTKHATHHIRLRCKTPIKQRYRPRNPAMQAIIDAEVEEMEKEGVIEPSTSAWSSPVVIVRKKDGTHRFCVDYQRLNQTTEKDVYPLPHITATLDKLREARYLSTLDLKNG